jgi:hypothetical protein
VLEALLHQWLGPRDQILCLAPLPQMVVVEVADIHQQRILLQLLEVPGVVEHLLQRHLELVRRVIPQILHLLKVIMVVMAREVHHLMVLEVGVQALLAQMLQVHLMLLVQVERVLLRQYQVFL